MAMRRARAVSVACFGDGAVGEGTVFESMNLAAVMKLPILFVCENNYYSTHMPIAECRLKRRIADIGAPLGIPGKSIDGNDVLAVYRATTAARARAVSGDGPTFLELRTYRLRGHVGPDDNIQGTHTDIRPAAEITRWRRRDPIRRFSNYLARNVGFSSTALQRIENTARREIEAAFEAARRSSFPHSEEYADDVYRATRP
jgi:pyruvate dehydrogenase E1 component alpha subunit